MRVFQHRLALCCSAALLLCAGCMEPPGKPSSASIASRPEQVLDATSLYRANCAACHGDQGQNGAAISLSNPVYLAIAGYDNLRRVTTEGIPGTMMPGFGTAHGGFLTDQQIDALAKGILHDWSRSDALEGKTAPTYAGAAHGDVTRGQQAFATYCSRCHGADGTGTSSSAPSPGASPQNASPQKKIGSIVDPAFLALISDQGLRSIVIAGMPEQGMPDWRKDLEGANAHPMTDQEITDVVAWLASHRVSTPGQPYPGAAPAQNDSAQPHSGGAQ
jgi:mono/diheme cytochrome c family protein